MVYIIFMYLISWQIMCFGQKTQQQQNRKSNMKILAWTGNRIGTPCTPVGCVTSGPPSQLNVSIVFKQINCFNAMGRYCRLINKAEFAGHTFSTSSLLWRVIKCYPWQSPVCPSVRPKFGVRSIIFERLHRFNSNLVCWLIKSKHRSSSIWVTIH